MGTERGSHHLGPCCNILERIPLLSCNSFTVWQMQDEYLHHGRNLLLHLATHFFHCPEK